MDYFNLKQSNGASNPSDDITMDEDEVTVCHACNICRKDLSLEPKIVCAVCEDITVCTECFSCGLEIREHRCDHPYRVDTLHIPRDETDWVLTEDRDLMQAVIECGYGNEVDLGGKFMHRNTEDVMKRVDRLLKLDTAPLQCRLEVEPLPLIPYNPEKFSEDPPRYPYNSTYTKSVAGYNPARGDFTSEFMNNAEEALCILRVSSDEEDSDEELTTELTTSIVEYHNHVQRERWRRKAIIKEHALILRKVHRSRVTEVAVFSQLLNRLDFDSLHIGLVQEENLRRKLLKLKKYRMLGITRLRGMAMYDRLEQMRLESRKDMRAIQDIPQARIPNEHKYHKTKRPLDLTTLPRNDELTPKERELCATARITPDNYLKAKTLFMEIAREEGGLTLKTARRVMKIDVNKTRKIYNFLLDNDLITEPPLDK